VKSQDGTYNTSGTGYPNATVERSSQADKIGPLKKIFRKLGLVDGNAWIRQARNAIIWPPGGKNWGDLSDEEQGRALDSLKDFALKTVEYGNLIVLLTI
jgi:hypothetical protein